MLEFIKLPGWEGLHPLVVHFPIGLLVILPLLLLLSIVIKEQNKCFTNASLIILIIGTIGTMLSVATGLAAMEVAKITEEAKEVLNKHESLAAICRNLYMSLTVFYAIFVYYTNKNIMKPSLKTALQIIFIVYSLLGIWFLINTGHYGARLVHEFGIHSIIK